MFLPYRRKLHRYWKALYFLVLCVVLFYFIIPIIFRSSYWIQRHLIFSHDVPLPSGIDFNDPLKLGIEGAYNRYISSQDVMIAAWQILPEKVLSVMPASFKVNERDKWFLEQLNDSRPVVIYCHGNMPSRASSHRIELYNILQKLNYHILAFDYRGYADSSKVIPSEDGLVEDTISVFEWVRRYSKSFIYVWGHSLGTGVATKAVGKLCSEGRCAKGLILQAPFTSLADEIRSVYMTQPFRILPWFDFMFIDPLTEQGIIFNNTEHISKVICPILILHAEDDYVVPFFLGKKLYDLGKHSRPRKAAMIKFISFDADLGYGHNNLYEAPELPLIIDLVQHNERDMSRDTKFQFQSFNITSNEMLTAKMLERVVMTYRRSVHSGAFLAAARKGTRAKREAKKKAAKVEEIKKVFIPYKKRLEMEKVGKISPRISDSGRPWPPVDDVYLMDEYKWRIFSVSEAAQLHRESVHETQMNQPVTDLIAHIELSMSADKKNRYIDEFSNILMLPFPYKVVHKRKILVLCRSEEMADEFRSYPGVTFAIGPKCIKMTEKGDLNLKLYDHILAHTSLLPDLVTIRAVMRKNMPSVKNKTAGADLKPLINRLNEGVEYKVIKNIFDHDFGSIDVSLGSLAFKDEELEANLEKIIVDVEAMRPVGRASRLITLVNLRTAASNENFKVDHSKYLPPLQIEETQDEAVA